LGREVPHWDQPIISSFGRGRIDLVCGRIGGVLHFLASAQAEPGLPNLVELGPSRVREPGAEGSPGDDDSPRGRIVLRTCQSEEGGRFYRDVNEYRIIDVGEACAPAPGSQWLTLAQIDALLGEGGWFTNEARCALSLLLAWL